MNWFLLSVSLALQVSLHGKPTGTPPSAPTEKQDCYDGELSASDMIACVNMDNQAKGKLPDDIHEGDILNENKHYHRRRRVTAHWLAWPKSADGYVYVSYTFGTSNSNTTRAFLSAIPEFNKFSCIRLVPKKSTDRNFIYLISGSGCYTYMGMQGGSQTLSLQAYTGCAHKGVAIHEILHVLGFYHEMSRRDRNQHIRIDLSNIYRSWWRQFDKHPVGNGSVYGEPYDTQSVMQYGNYAAAISRSRHSITSIKNPTEKLGQRNGFSQKDLKQLNRMYQCEKFIKRV